MATLREGDLLRLGLRARQARKFAQHLPSLVALRGARAADRRQGPRPAARPPAAAAAAAAFLRTLLALGPEPAAP